MKIVLTCRTLALAALLVPAAAQATDRWERGNYSDLSNDDTIGTTRNELRPGDRQTGHDLEGTPIAPDYDFFLVKTQVYHTYEALVRSGTLFWGKGTPFCVPPGGTSVCPRFDLINSLGILQTEGEWDGASNSSNVASAMRIVMYGTGGTSYLRVQGDTGGSNHTSLDQYDIEFHDTTYAIPRFNNSGTQTTIVIVQNTADRAVHVDIVFLDPAGSMVMIVGQDVAPFGTWVQPTAGLAPLAGRSGAILVRHNGPVGALSGKGVAVEPATGFTFDTAMTPVEH